MLVTAGVVCARQQPETRPGLRLADVYVAGEGGYHTYRIPAVVATPKGTLLAMAEGRWLTEGKGK